MGRTHSRDARRSVDTVSEPARSRSLVVVDATRSVCKPTRKRDADVDVGRFERFAAARLNSGEFVHWRACAHNRTWG
jgi:hypothetical protein